LLLVTKGEISFRVDNAPSKSQKPSRRPGLKLIAKAIAKTSNATKGMISTIVIIVLLGLWFSFLESSSVAVIFIACVGGMLVFLGLWIEKDADKEEKKYLSTIARAVRLVKLKSEIGWCILMAGIVIEIIVAGFTAIGERKTLELARNSDPINQPVNDITADGLFFTRGTNLIGPQSYTVVDPYGVGFIDVKVKNAQCCAGGIAKFTMTSHRYTSMMLPSAGTASQYMSSFEVDPEIRIVMRGDLHDMTASEALDNIYALNVVLSGIPLNARDIDGLITVQLNHTPKLQKRFDLRGAQMQWSITGNSQTVSFVVTNAIP
jgi:hypothetical protein